MKLRIVSFNVKCAWYNKTLDHVAEILKRIDGDLVGLQELDVATSRIAKNGDVVNQLEYIAEKAGYPYFCYTKVLDYRGGFYGHGIISKYPIKEHSVIWPKVQNLQGEVRAIGRHVFEIEGKEIVFYNSHLSNGTITPQQYAEVQNDYMVNEKYPIFVGDLNARPEHFKGFLDTDKYVTLTGGEDLSHFIKTSGGGNAIDHIILSRKTMTYEMGDTETGLHVIDHEGSSDHNLVYADVTLN